MKLLLLTRSTGGAGGMIVLTSLYRGLVDKGHDVDFVAFKPEGTPSFPAGETLYDGIDVHFVSVPYHENNDAQIKEQIDAGVVYLKANHSAYDRLVLDSWYMMVAGAIAQITGSRKVFHLAQRDPVFEPEDNSKIWLAKTLDLICLIPTQRIVVGRSLTRILNERYSAHYSVLDPFVDDIYRAGQFVVREQSPIKFVASAANFNPPWKGLDFLIESLLRFNEVPFELTLISGSPIARDISNMDFPIRVVSAESPAAMKQILLQNDVYVCASTSESFCLALAEAVTLGMPSIALDSVGNRDYMQNDNFLFIKAKNDFLPGLNEICKLETRHQLHSVARSSMRAYTLDRMVDQFADALNI